MARKTLKLIARPTIGLAVFAVLLGGWGTAAHAQYYCDNANCVMSVQRAHDPAYQAAIHSGWYSPHQYGLYSYNPLYPSYEYQNYAFQYQYQYQYQYGNTYPPQMNPAYWMNGCMYSMQPCGY